MTLITSLVGVRYADEVTEALDTVVAEFGGVSVRDRKSVV